MINIKYAFLLLVFVALPVQADLAFKLFGAASANDLSPEIEAAMLETGVEVSNDFACFELPLLSLRTERVVGTGVDCLNIFDDSSDANGAGARIEAITFFFMNKRSEGGTLVNHGCTSVRPFFEGVGDSGVTHMTGSIAPKELGGDNPPLHDSPCAEAGGVVHTTRAMSRFTDGEVRLSGAVNLSKLMSDGEITFSCLFVIKQGD